MLVLSTSAVIVFAAIIGFSSGAMRGLEEYTESSASICIAIPEKGQNLRQQQLKQQQQERDSSTSSIPPPVSSMHTDRRNPLLANTFDSQNKRSYHEPYIERVSFQHHAAENSPPRTTEDKVKVYHFGGQSLGDHILLVNPSLHKASTLKSSNDERSTEKSLVETDLLIKNKRSLSGPPNIIDDWIFIDPNGSGGDMRTSIQYYVKNKNDGVRSIWAGQTVINDVLMTPGHHILSYEQGIVMGNRLSLTVWFDNKELPFERNKDPGMNTANYVPAKVVFHGSELLQKSARALCIEDVNPAASSPKNPENTTLAIVASSLLFVLLLAGVVTLVLVRRCSRTDALRIAGETAPDRLVAGTVAGLEEGDRGRSEKEKSTGDRSVE